MAKIYLNGFAVKDIYLGSAAVKRIYLGSKLLYSAGSSVTYVVDIGESYEEEAADGASVLSPTSFTPQKSGYTFLGWRLDQAASGEVLTQKTMEGEPLTLYAVFGKAITLTYNGNNSTGGSTAAETKYQYYNNGNVSGAPVFTVKACGFTRTDYSFVWWSSATTQYSPGDTLTLTNSTTLYAQWKAVPFTVPLDSLTWTFRDLYGNGTLGHSQSASKVQVSIQANGSAQAVGRASATINTRGCNLCRVKYATYFATGGTGLAAINDQSLNNTNGVVQEAYVSVSGSSWELYFDAKDSDTYGENYMFITEILMTHS